jgi:CHASE2 domain-containing sensor protein
MATFRFLHVLASRGLFYWSFVLALIGVGVYLEEALNQQKLFLSAEYKIYRFYRQVSPLPIQATRTAVVLVDDEDYWKGDLARRVPIKRRYLASLLRKLAAGNPQVIALDFNLRSPALDGTMLDNKDYECETADLERAVLEVAQKRIVVVLPTTVGRDGAGYYYRLPDVFDHLEQRNRNISVGYIMPTVDIRQVPLQLAARGGLPLDSFASAIVRRVDDSSLRYLAGDAAFPFGIFMEPKSFEKTILARQVWDLSDDQLSALLATKSVLVGAAWHEAAYGAGKHIDLHETPAGDIPGVFILANYVEALLNGHFTKPLGVALSRTAEVIFSLAVAIGLASVRRVVAKALVVVGTCVAIVVLSYITYQNFGRFFDVFFPVVLVAAHALAENQRELIRDAHRYRHERSGQLNPL